MTAPFPVRRIAGAVATLCLLAAQGLGAPPVLAQTGSLNDIEATARETCETGIGSLESIVAAPQGAGAEAIGKARTALAEARRSYSAGDYTGCFTHLEAGLTAMGATPMQFNAPR